MKSVLDKKLQIAEFLGMHIGDGTLYKTNSNTLVWEMKGDLKEKEYYDNHVFPLLKELFKLKQKPKYRSGGKNGCYGIETTNKSLIQTILENNIESGKKINIKIPREIKNSDIEVKKAFLRGYFDTDGCIRFEKKSFGKYPKIEFCSISEQLIRDIVKISSDLEFKSYTWKRIPKRGFNEHRLCLAGVKNYNLWKKDIKSHNPKHLKKFSESLTKD